MQNSPYESTTSKRFEQVLSYYDIHCRLEFLNSFSSSVHIQWNTRQIIHLNSSFMVTYSGRRLFYTERCQKIWWDNFSLLALPASFMTFRPDAFLSTVFPYSATPCSKYPLPFLSSFLKSLQFFGSFRIPFIPFPLIWKVSSSIPSSPAAFHQSVIQVEYGMPAE